MSGDSRESANDIFVLQILGCYRVLDEMLMGLRELLIIQFGIRLNSGFSI